MLNTITGVFKRRKRSSSPLTLEDAISEGLVDPEAHARANGGGVELEGVIWPHWPGWSFWRANRRKVYYGGQPLIEIRDAPSGVRTPIIDLGAGATDIEMNAAKGVLIDQGSAKGPVE
jgi:hypothetical protein